MAKGAPTPAPGQIENFTFDVAADQQSRDADRLGMKEVDDQGPGRADFDEQNATFDEWKVENPETQNLAAEKAIRNAEWARQASMPEQQAMGRMPQQQQQASDPLSDLQAKLEEANKRAERLSQELGRSEDRRGKDRQRFREVEGRLGQMEAMIRNGGPQPMMYPNPYGPRMQMGDPTVGMTFDQVQQLMIAQSEAFGQKMAESEQRAIQTARLIQGYNVPVTKEQDILDANPGLEMLPPAQRYPIIQRLAAISGPTPQPQRVEQVRAQARQVQQFIEPSTRGSQQEVSAQTPQQAAVGQDLQKLQEALSRSDGRGAEEALKILSRLGAGPVDDTLGTINPRGPGR